jgi:hypothetical protein
MEDKLGAIPYNNPLKKLYENNYRIDTRSYPRNVMQDQRGHYILFYVNVAENTSFTGDLGGDYDFEPNRGGGIFTGETSSEKKALVNIPFSENFTEDGKEVSIKLAAKTKRLKSAIALYMPENINVQYGANYQDTSITNAFGRFGALLQNADSVIDSIMDGFKSDYGNKLSTIGENLRPQVTDTLAVAAGNLFGQDAGDIVLFAGGYAINPQLEVLFKGINLRSFQFDFIFSPYDRDEAQSVKDIIDTFKFHAAPEVLASGSGRYMVPPSEFDIKFMYKTEENKNIHKIGTCVLTNISIDYAPDGWATFGGVPNQKGAGSPTQTKLSLQFMETEIVDKQKITEGY